MQVSELGLRGLKLITPRRHQDDRGWFAEIYNRQSFRQAGLPTEFVQDNQSSSRRGVLRGLHIQNRQPQGKLVRVLTGSIWDVAVDLRRESPTFGRWFGMDLCAGQPDGEVQMLWIPEGLAHGFLVLSETAEVEYKVTRPYDPGGEQTIVWNDPQLGITWPLHRLNGTPPVLSAKDAAGLLLTQALSFFPGQPCAANQA
ncbi:MAG TPA: dTDP-4-dehydrorhamnose 3,5-epimerase [Acidobacteriaceae bacterium]|nr:dTDP-4-dehydrorhamnose 3,5-epimerase [Acidobacteriaceae bacterium]